LAMTRQRFPLTPLLYSLILLHCVVLMIGGHYTYAEVPLFDTIKPWFGWERNNYDKLGHFLQGFVPAMIARELLIRKAVMASAYWRNFFSVCFCLAFSAFYELIEWWVALLSGSGAEAFLGTQGYVWDTQSDMGFALLGAILALLLLGGLHDRQLRKRDDGDRKTLPDA
jgi:putative membrane protein